MLALALALFAPLPLAEAVLDSSYLPAAEFVPAPAGAPPCPHPDCDDVWVKEPMLPIALEGAASTSTPPPLPEAAQASVEASYVLSMPEIPE